MCRPPGGPEHEPDASAAYFSNAVLGGRFVLRCCIVNFRTEAEHLERVVSVTTELGAKLDAVYRPDRLGK